METRLNNRLVPSATRDAAKGRAILLAAAAMWSTSGALIKLIHQGGAGPNGWVIGFYRSFFAALTLTPAAVRRLSRLTWTPWLLASVLAFTAMGVTLILAVTMTTAANAIVLQYTAPIWVFALSPILLRERPAPRDWFLLALGMAGVVVIFLGRDERHLAGLLVALSSGLAFGLLTLIFRRLRHIDSILLAWVNNIGAVIVLLPYVAAAFDLSPSGRSMLLLAIMGIFQCALAYVLYAWGLKYTNAPQASVIILIEPVLNVLWTWLVAGEKPGLATIIGGAIILAAVAAQSLRRPA
jgi:drug/metabolite transporter, DME family